MFLSLDTSITHYERSKSRVYAFASHGNLMCEKMFMPFSIKPTDVGGYLAKRRWLIAKQLRDRRIVVSDGGGVGLYSADTKVLLKPTEYKGWCKPLTP